MLRLYQRAVEGRPPRVRWTLEEAGAEYEWVAMDEEEGRGAEHARRHPLGRVPVLETDDGLLFESAALCLHVADLFPDAGLIPPPGTYERGLVYQWVLFAMTEFEPTMVRSIYARRRNEPVEEADERLAVVAAATAAALEARSFIAGDRFSVADIVLGGVLHGARRYSVLPSGRLHEYLESLDARPAKQRAYAGSPKFGLTHEG